MGNLRTAEIKRLIAQHNDAEIRSRRDYYEYLSEKEAQTESFEEHLAKYGKLTETGDVATDEDIHLLESRLSMTIPKELQEFYQTFGKISHQSGQVFSVSELLGFLNGIPLSTFPGVPKTLGIVDMIKLSWGNDRWEFEAESGCIEQAEIDLLNSRYLCLGWFWKGDLESASYVYFDTVGNMGTIYYHQDSSEDLGEEFVLPLLARSSEDSMTLSEIVLASL